LSPAHPHRKGLSRGSTPSKGVDKRAPGLCGYFIAKVLCDGASLASKSAGSGRHCRPGRVYIFDQFRFHGTIENTGQTQKSGRGTRRAPLCAVANAVAVWTKISRRQGDVLHGDEFHGFTLNSGSAVGSVEFSDLRNAPCLYRMPSGRGQLYKIPPRHRVASNRNGCY